MIAEKLGISCSKRCELLIAASYVFSNESVISIAHRLTNDKDLSAIKLASALMDLPRSKARAMAIATLTKAGFSFLGINHAS